MCSAECFFHISFAEKLLTYTQNSISQLIISPNTLKINEEQERIFFLEKSAQAKIIINIEKTSKLETAEVISRLLNIHMIRGNVLINLPTEKLNEAKTNTIISGIIPFELGKATTVYHNELKIILERPSGIKTINNMIYSIVIHISNINKDSDAVIKLSLITETFFKYLFTTNGAVTQKVDQFNEFNGYIDLNNKQSGVILDLLCSSTKINNAKLFIKYSTTKLIDKNTLAEEVPKFEDSDARGIFDTVSRKVFII